MEKSILSYIWRYSKSQQLVIVALTFVSFPLLYLSLELPKWIINDVLSRPEAPHSVLGWELTPLMYLVLLCVLLLTLVIANGALKMRINTYKGLIGERLVRRLRFSLIDRILKFPLKAFSRISSGELISTVTSETEPLAGYISESIALPLFQGGTMLTILLFMFMQDWVFGLVSVALIPVQGYLIPKLQKQVNKLKKERVRRVRKLSERIGETVDGAAEIRLHGTEPYTLAEFSERLGDLFYVRLDIFKKKFFMKFLNNTIGQITPFLFYMFGGYLVLKGDLTIGALVAAIGAYKDLTSPWRELLNHYQAHEDAKIKYLQIVEQFSPEDLYQASDSEIGDSVSKNQADEGGLAVRGVSYRSESGETILNGIDFHINPGEMVAIVGDYPVRRARLAAILAGLDQPERGQVMIGGVSSATISNEWFRSRVGLQSENPHMFSGSIADNVVYGLNHSPPSLEQHGEEQDSEELKKNSESRVAGNSEFSFRGDWKDYGAIGAADRAEMIDWYMQTAEAIEATSIMYSRSMFEVFDPDARPELASRLLQVRKLIRRQLVARNMQDLVSQFDPDIYNPNASVGENIVFGVIDYDDLKEHRLAARAHINKVLRQSGIYEQALETGLIVATRMVDVYRDVGDTAGILAEFGLDTEEQLEALVELVDSGKPVEKMKDSEIDTLRYLFQRIVPARHSFVPLDFRLTTKLVQVRRDFERTHPPELDHLVVPFVVEKYHPRLNVKDNLLFGRIAKHDPESQRQVDELISDCIDQVGVRTDLMLLLAESQVGINGSRLPVTAKHRISLGRIVFKKPKVIIFLDALGPYDEPLRRRLRANIRALLPDVTIVWLDRDVSDANEFDRVLTFSADGPLQVSYDGTNPIADTTQDSVVAGANTAEALTPGSACDDVDQNDPFALISCSRMFSSLSSAQQQFLADHSRLVTMQASSAIYHQGDEADSVYLLMRGEVQSIRKNGDIMGQLGRMEVLGLLETLAGRPRLLSANTLTDVTMLRIDADAIHDISEDDSVVMRKLLQALTEQFTGANRDDDDQQAA